MVVDTEQEYKVIIDFVGEHFDIDDFNVDLDESILSKWELGGITDPIGQVTSWFYEKISTALTALGNSITTFVSNLIEPIRNTVDTILSIVSSIESNITGLTNEIINSFETTISNLTNTISSVFNTIEIAITNISTSILSIRTYVINAIENAVNEIQYSISAISSSITSITSYVSEIENTIINTVESLENSLVNIVSEIRSIVEPLYAFITTFESKIAEIISNSIESLVSYLSNVSKNISLTLTNISTTFTEFIVKIRTVIANSLKEYSGAITSLIDNIRNSVTNTYIKLKTYFGNFIVDILESMNEVKTALMGFVNPMVEIKFVFANLYELLSSFVNSIKNSMIQYFESLPEYVSNIANSLKSISEIPSEIAKAISNIKGEFTIAQSFVRDTIEYVEKDAENVITFVRSEFASIRTGIVNSLSNVITFVNNVESDIRKVMSKLIENFTNILTNSLTTVVSSIFESYLEFEYFKTIVSNSKSIMSKLIEAILSFLIIESMSELINEEVISLEIFGLGGQIRSKIGKAIEKIPESFRKAIVKIAEEISFAWLFWAIEPFKYQYYKFAREIYPVEIPSVHELTEITRRQLVTNDFEAYYENMINSLEYRGYQDWTIKAWTNLVSNKAYVMVKDRFGKERKFPTSILYEIPSISELCRMMVKDLFNPENPLPEFERAMLMHGVIPDIAKMYYLLHFRYPPLDTLFKFVCRASAGFAWVTEKPTKYEDLGYEGKSPAGLNNTDWRKAVDTLNKYVEFIIPYSKWHDYSPFSWIKGFTADRLIVVDMMARLPDKIDSRWMFKWSIIDDTMMYRLILSEGYHPNFVKNIAIAEMLNVIGESRTQVRSGLLEMYRTGLIDDKTLNESLSNITNVKLLDTNVTVRYLDAEIEMIGMRAKYDLSSELMRYAIREISRLFYENVITKDEMLDEITQIANEISKALNVNVSLNDSYVEVLSSITTFEYELYTINRVRIWIRYLLYRLMERFSEGYVKKSEIDDFINVLSNEAKLTDAEKQLLVESAYLMYDFFVRKTKADAILRRLARGVITEDKAKAELRKLGLDESVIDALIEEHVKLYTFSVEHLIEMSEYVPVDTKFIESKAKLYGMPEQELKLLPAYKVAKDVASYLQRYITELIDDYEYGLIDRKTLEKKIDEARTLNGKVKRYGVDWIVIDDTEKEFILEIAEMRRKRHELIEAMKQSYSR